MPLNTRTLSATLLVKSIQGDVAPLMQAFMQIKVCVLHESDQIPFSLVGQLKNFLS